MKKQFLITYIVEGITLIIGFYVFKLVFIKFGENGFNEFTIGRRIIGVLQTISLLGFGVGLPRFISFTKSNDTQLITSYIYTSYKIILFFCFTLSLILFFFRNELSYLLFKSYDYQNLILPILIFNLGLTFHSIVYSTLRGLLKIETFNLLQFINLAFITISLVFLVNNIKNYFFSAGILYLLVSYIFFYLVIRKNFKKNNLTSKKYYNECKELKKYSIKRVPGDIAYSLVFYLPVLFSTHIYDVNIAAFLSFSLSYLNLHAAIYSPIGIILLPKLSELLGQKHYKDFKKYVNLLLIFTIISAIILTIINFTILSNFVISKFFGKDYLKYIMITKIITLSILPFVFFIIFRNVFDAYYVSPVNAYNIIISIIIFVTTFTFSKFILKINFNNYYSFAILTLILFFSLGILSSIKLINIFKSIKIKKCLN